MANRLRTQQTACGPTVKLRLYRLYWEAARLYGRDNRGAAERFARFTDAAPEDWFALLMLAWSHEGAGQDTEALAAALRAVAGRPADVEALQTVARLHSKLGDHERAKEYVERTLAAIPGDPVDGRTRWISLLMRGIDAIARLFRRLRGDTRALKEVDVDLVRDRQQLTEWAHQYLAWHARTFPPPGAVGGHNAVSSTTSSAPDSPLAPRISPESRSADFRTK